MATSDDSATYVGSCDVTQPADTDAPSKGAAEIRQVKIQNKTSFPAVTGAVTSTHTELNILDGATVTTTELNYLDGTTPGTAVASKALACNANKDLAGLRDLTITGDLKVDAAADALLSIDGAAGQQRRIAFQASGLTRATLGLDTVAETGSNAGSNVFLSVSDDAGSYLNRVLTIERANSNIYINGFDTKGYGSDYQVEITQGTGEEGLLVASPTTDNGTITISGNRTGNGNDVALLEFANRDSSSTTHTAIASISAERQGVDGLDLTFSLPESGVAAEQLRIKANGDINASGTTCSFGYYPGTDDVSIKAGYGRSGDGSTYYDLISDATNQFTYSARLIRNSGANGIMEVLNKGTGGIRLHNSGAAPIEFYVSGTEAARIDTSSNLLVGKTAVSATTTGFEAYATGFTRSVVNNGQCGVFNREGTSAGTNVIVDFRDNDTAKFRIMMDGDWETSGSQTAISDARLKENIVDANSQWEDIKAMRWVNFNMIEDPDKRMLGVIAQEIEQVSPDLVKTDDDGMKSVRMSLIYTKAMKALQEAMSRIESLEAEVAALKAG